MRPIIPLLAVFLWLFSADALMAQRIMGKVPSTVTSGAVWSTPGEAFEGKIRKEWFGCLEKPEGKTECIGKTMQKYGASDEAVEVNRHLEGLGYATSFKKMGIIDLLTVVYPGSNYGTLHFFVNGQPPFLSVEDSARTVAQDIKKDPLYPLLLKEYPSLGLWTDNGMLLEQTRIVEGATDIDFLFPLRDGCHACRIGGYGRVVFRFSQAGLFKGTSFSHILEMKERFRDTDNGRMFVVEKGKPFTIELSANPSTGYTWAFDGLNGEYFRLAGSDYEPSSPRLAGSGGTSRWQLTALRAGVAQIRLLYYRPWEGPGTAVKEYSLTLMIR
jgi:predicted secreted protein